MTRALGLLLTAVAIAAAAPSTSAGAAEPKRPSAGLRAYGLDWIQYLRPKDLPPTRYAVCIVDNGVAITPDTPPDNPNGPILKRLAIDGGSGEPQGTTPQHLHGTRMAATAIAPRNNWGTVGMFPQGRIISVRASVDGEATFRVKGYARGLDRCLTESLSTPIAAISLSIACGHCAVAEAEVAELTNRMRRASSRAIPVFVAAGNQGGAVEFPASVPGSLPVVAGGNRGRACRGASSGPTAVALAPACPVHGAEPLSGAAEPASDGGSSVATIEVAALTSLLRTARPEQPSFALDSLLATRSHRYAGRAVDGRAGGRAAGFGDLIRKIDMRIRRER